MEKAQLEEVYKKTLVPQLQERLGCKNIMEVPKVTKVVLNIGVKDAVGDSKAIQLATDVLTKIAGQKPVRTTAKKSIAGFKLREGMPIGVMVTLRGRNMYDFLNKLINLALPKVRDFQGIPTKFDGRGGYNLGVKEWTIFPEVEYDLGGKTYGLNITIQTSARNDQHARVLLESFGMPFRKI